MIGSRRVLIGERGGVPAVISDDVPARTVDMASMPGTRFVHLWGTDGREQGSRSEGDAALELHPFNLGAGETRFSLARLPSNAELDAAAGGKYEEDPDEVRLDYQERYGELAPGHAVTYGLVLEGNPAIRAGEDRVQLAPGDAVVNTGVEYHWENPGDSAAWIVFVRVGIAPEASSSQ